MKKKGLILTLSIIGAILLIFAITLAIVFFSGNNITIARCVVTDGGTLYMIYGERPVRLNTDKETDYKTGDKLLIVHSAAFDESYPERTRAILIVKIGSGSGKNVPQKIFDALDGLRVYPGDKTLNFRITQNIENYSFEGFDEIYGRFGALEYLGWGTRKPWSPTERSVSRCIMSATL